jgi:hypothetical protein
MVPKVANDVFMRGFIAFARVAVKSHLPTKTPPGSAQARRATFY